VKIDQVILKIVVLIEWNKTFTVLETPVELKSIIWIEISSGRMKLTLLNWRVNRGQMADKGTREL